MRLKLFNPAIAVVVLMSGAIASTAPIALAQQTPANERPKKEQHENRIFQQLNLMPEQTQRIRAIQEQYRPQIQQRRQALRMANKELRTLMQSDATDEQIRDKYRQVETQQQQFASLMFERLLAMRNVLTVEQRHQAAELMKRERATLYRQQTPPQ